MKPQSTIVSYEMEFVNLDQFIDKINIVPTDEDRFVPYNTLIRYSNPFFKDDKFDNEETSHYQRRTTLLVKTREELKNQLISQLSVSNRFMGDLQNLVEEIAVDSAMNYGQPTYMVNVGPRMWLAANPDDFRIYSNNNKLAIACVAAGRNVINNILKMTEEEAIKETKKCMNKMESK